MLREWRYRLWSRDGTRLFAEQGSAAGSAAGSGAAGCRVEELLAVGGSAAAAAGAAAASRSAKAVKAAAVKAAAAKAKAAAAAKAKAAKAKAAKAQQAAAARARARAARAASPAERPRKPRAKKDSGFLPSFGGGGGRRTGKRGLASGAAELAPSSAFARSAPTIDIAAVVRGAGAAAPEIDAEAYEYLESDSSDDARAEAMRRPFSPLARREGASAADEDSAVDAEESEDGDGDDDEEEEEER